MRFSRTSVALTATLSVIVGACDPSTRAVGPDGLPTSANLDHGVTATGGSCIAGVSTLVISVSRKEIEVGGESILFASLLDASGESLPSGSVVWAIGDESIASQFVESSGHAAVRGVKAGTTTVTAKCGSFAETGSITVGGGAPADTTTKGGMSVQVTLSASELNAGQTTQAVFNLKDAAGNVVAASSAAWSSSNGSVASVNDQGLVTGVAVGTTAISASVNGVSGSANLTVAGSNTPEQPTPPPTNPDPGSGVTATTPELPRASGDARYVPPTGQTINVPSGGDLQGAINSANRGDVILLAPGATYFGPITLPAKPGSGWITIRTAASDGALPAEGQRITPSYAGQLPKIVGGGANAAVLLTSAGASGYRVMGVEITAGSSIVNLTSLVELGEGGGFYQFSLGVVASDLVLDRVYIHGQSTTNLQRCVALNSARTAIVNSWITDCHGRQMDTQAIAGWNGPGPYLIENNQLEGAGENIMFGGADAVINGLSPSDITIRRNHIRKPPEWRGVWQVKNLFELKHAKRVLVEGNVFENNWADAQDGVAIVLKSTNQSGTNPWAQTADVTFRYNVLRNSPQGLNIAANPDIYTAAMTVIPAARFLVEQNLFENIGTFNSTTNGNMLVLTNYLANVTISHNTLNFNYSQGLLLTMESYPVLGSARNIVVNDNVVTPGRYYQIMHSGIKVGTESMNAFAGSSWAFNRNVIIGVDPDYVSYHPQSSFYPTTMGQVGFSSSSNGDYRLSPSSPFKGRATDGTDPGANFDELNRRISGVVVR
jgi:Bacterial Ig-like domain (group 2)/Right handed beta helix region